MTMTNAQIVVTLNMINSLKQDKRKLPVRVSYALNKNQNILMNTYKPYEETLKELNTETDKQAVAELLNEENEIVLHNINLDDLDGADLTINEMDIIQNFMMTEEE